MKALYTYKPMGASDTSVVITASPALANFTTNNLFDIQPTKTYKTMNNVGDKFVKYDAGIGNTFNINTVFLNRFNFASFRIQGSNDDFATTPVDILISGLTRDEIYDPNSLEILSDNYMHYWYEFSTPFNYRFIRIYIPAQTPLFETSYFKIGNFLIGNYTQSWSPRSGFIVSTNPNLNITEYDSGYESVYKKGKSYRIFEGNFDKITVAEYNKIVQGYNPIVLYFDWTANNNQAYLVRKYREAKHSYDYADILSVDLSFRELV
jgi:hypothetical protein